MDLLSMSEDELYKIWANDGEEELKTLIFESELDAEGLATLFANNPSLEDTILSCVPNHYELYFILDEGEREMRREYPSATNPKRSAEMANDIKKYSNALERLSKSELFDRDMEALVDYVIANPHNSKDAIYMADDVLELYDRLNARRISLHKVIDKDGEKHNTTVEGLLDDIEQVIQSQGYSSIGELRQEKAEEKKVELKALIDFVDNHIEHAGFTPEELRSICEDYGFDFDDIDRITLHDLYQKHGYAYDITTDTRSADTYARLMIESDKELEEFYEENPDLDDRPASPIPAGMSVEEFEEAINTPYINDFGEIIRPDNVEVSDVPFGIAFMYRRKVEIENRLEELNSLDEDSALLIDAGFEIDELTEELEEIESELASYEARKKTPLQQREAELSAEEEKAKKYSELEALIAKQKAKQGEQL